MNSPAAGALTIELVSADESVCSVAIRSGRPAGLGKLFAGRAAFLLVGAMIATTMSGNVFFWIIPGQKTVVEAIRNGQPVDPVHGQRGKQRHEVNRVKGEREEHEQRAERDEERAAQALV